MQWFRLHNKLLNDPVVQGLNDKQFKIYINLLCHASALDKDGYIGSIDETSFALRETKDNVSSCFIAFQEVGLLVTSVTDSETFHIPQWRKKQYKSDTSTARVKKHREKVKRSKTVTVTPPDTDTEQIQSTDTEQNIYVSFDDFWNVYPRKTDKAKAKKVWDKLKIDDDLFQSISNHCLTAFIGTEKKFIPHATTYLNNKRWEDEIIADEKAVKQSENDAAIEAWARGEDVSQGNLIEGEIING